MVFDLQAVSFRYRKDTPIFDDVHFVFPTGRTALLGVNGAGKSTLMGLLTGSLTPQSGTIALDGRTGALMRRGLGYMPQQIKAIRGLRVLEQVRYCGWLQGMRYADTRTAALGVLARVGLENLQRRRSHELSGGQLRRLGLACALVHDPQVLVLDEPAAGLDPEQRAGFRTLLQTLPASTQLLVSTHLVDDIENLFDNVVVIHHGRFSWSGPVSAFNDPNNPAASMEDAFLQHIGATR